VDSDTYAREPNTGDLVTSYSVFARNCITCREDDNDEIRIRIQTNNMPKGCYGSDNDVDYYPDTKKIDIELLWNPDVLSTQNVASSNTNSASATTSLLCDQSWSATLPDSSDLDENEPVAIDSFVGFSMENVIIANALTSGDEDAVSAYMSSYD